MRVRRWVVYKMSALPPPDDRVRSVSRHWTRRGAHRARRRLGPTSHQWIEMASAALGGYCAKPADHYFMVSRRARRRPWWVRRRNRRRRPIT